MTPIFQDVPAILATRQLLADIPAAPPDLRTRNAMQLDLVDRLQAMVEIDRVTALVTVSEQFRKKFPHPNQEA